MKKKPQIRHSLGFIAVFGAFLIFGIDSFAQSNDYQKILDYSFDENGKIYVQWQINQATPDAVYLIRDASFCSPVVDEDWYCWTGVNNSATGDKVITAYPTYFWQHSVGYLFYRSGGLLMSDIPAFYLDKIKTLFYEKSASYIEYHPPLGTCSGYCNTLSTFNFGAPPIPPILIEPYITITTPTSGTVITASSDTNYLIGNYYNINPEIYQGFLINFKDEKLKNASDSFDYKLATGDSGAGSFIVPLSKFNISQNGHWDLYGLAYGMALDIQSGLFLTTRGYIDFFSDELVKTPYYLIFNVEGFSEPFTFENWNDWYSNNVSEYENPQPVVSVIAGFIQPIFEKIGGFGANISLYWNLNEAFDRGFGLGQIFPTIQEYIKKIEMFFGGFPLFTFLKYILLILMAIFIVRTILKFIPFIG